MKENSENLSHYSKRTQQWIENVVLGLNLCPFAGPSWSRGEWKISVIDDRDPSTVIKECIKEIESTAKQMETTSLQNQIIVLPYCDKEFILYFDLFSLIEEELEYKGLLETVQVVAFHPGFFFADGQRHDRGNYVNRSPYPSIHILKKSSMDKVVLEMGDGIGESVSLRNKKILEDLDDIDFKSRVLDYIEGPININQG